MNQLRLLFLFAATALFLSASCDQQKENNNDLPTDTLPPVETESPNTSFQPAFEGQTRVAGVITSTEYEANVINDNLDSPWAVTALPDGRLAITEKGGTLRIAQLDGTMSDKIGGFPEVDDRSQGGLMDVAHAPDFSTSRMLYFTLAERTPEGSLTAVGKGRLSEDETRIENFQIIIPCHSLLRQQHALRQPPSVR